MNIFTKEELQDILIIYRAFIADSISVTDLDRGIIKKLKSMIDSEQSQHDIDKMFIQINLLSATIINIDARVQTIENQIQTIKNHLII